MYERFTDRARYVLKLANTEAQRFSHEYIGTEHILLGLTKVNEGLATHVLTHLKVDPRKIRIELENLLQPGPELVTMSKLPMTPSAKKVIEYAIGESSRLEHDYIGTEHLLLGLLLEKEGVAAVVLMNSGIAFEDVLQEMRNSLELDSRPIEITSPATVPTGVAELKSLSESAKSAINIIRNLSPDERQVVIKKILNYTLKVDPPNTLNDIGFEVKSTFWISVWDFFLWLVPFVPRRKYLPTKSQNSKAADT